MGPHGLIPNRPAEGSGGTGLGGGAIDPQQLEDVSVRGAGGQREGPEGPSQPARQHRGAWASPGAGAVSSRSHQPRLDKASGRWSPFPWPPHKGEALVGHSPGSPCKLGTSEPFQRPLASDTRRSRAFTCREHLPFSITPHIQGLETVFPPQFLF